MQQGSKPTDGNDGHTMTVWGMIADLAAHDGSTMAGLTMAADHGEKNTMIRGNHHLTVHGKEDVRNRAHPLMHLAHPPRKAARRAIMLVPCAPAQCPPPLA